MINGLRLLIPMNREEFSNLVSMTIEEVVQFAEEKAGEKLPETKRRQTVRL
jgi:hypothetical protein